jgi:hypothetical protein
MASIGGIFISFLWMLVTICLILIIAYAMLWVISWFGWSIDANVLKFCKVLVALLCLIVIVTWLFGALGGAMGLSHAPFLGR